MLAALDVQNQRVTAAQPHDLFVERRVALHVGHIGTYQVGIAGAGQDAGHHQRVAGLAGDPLTIRPSGAQLKLHLTERIVLQGARLGVQLDVETRQLRHHQRVVEAGQEVLIVGVGAAVTAHQPGLQLETANIAAIQPDILIKPLLEQRSLLFEALLVAGEILFVEVLVADFLTHGRACLWLPVMSKV